MGGPPAANRPAKRSEGLWMDDQVHFDGGFSDEAGEASVVLGNQVRSADGLEAAVEGHGGFRRCAQGEGVCIGKDKRRGNLDGDVLWVGLRALRCLPTGGALDDAAKEGRR